MFGKSEGARGMLEKMVDQGETGDTFRAARLYDVLSGTLTLGRRDQVFDRAAAALPSTPLLSATPSGLIVDVGCGTGALSFALARRFPDAGVLGIDPSAEMVGRARSQAAKKGIDLSFETGTAQSLAVDDEAAVAVCFSLSLHHLPAADRPAALGEAVRVLRPGGSILVVEFDPVGRIGSAMSMHDGDIAEKLSVTEALGDAGFRSVEQGRVTNRLLGWWTGRKLACD